MTIAAFASEADSELPRSLAIPLMELVNALLAASNSLQRLLFRSDCAPEMSWRSVLMASSSSLRHLS